MKKSIFVLTFVFIVVIGVYVSFNIYTNRSYGITEEKAFKSLNIDSEEIQKLKNILTTSDYLRGGAYSSKNVSQEIMLKQILLSIQEGDYKEKNVRPTKVMCVVKNKLWFMSPDTCKIRIISDDTINKYALKLFNYKGEIKIDEIEFKGLHCKYSDKYYCHINYYKDSWHDYSLLDKSYKDKKNIYLYEYYLRINSDDEEQCLKYYGEEYCNDKKLDLPEVKDGVIKEDGVYYKHTFKQTALGEYYLYSSEVVY